MTDQTYTLRPSTDDDLPFLRDVYFSTRQEEMRVTGWPPPQQLAFLMSQFEAQDAHYRRTFTRCEFLVIETGGEPAGRLYLDRREDEIRIVDIAVLPPFQGRGLGSRIIEDIFAEARERDCPVRIHVEQANAARRLYDRLGFEPVQNDGIYILMEYLPDHQT